MRLITAITLVFLAACSAPAQSPAEAPGVVEPEGELTLEGARQRWAGNGFGHYRYVLRQECYCPREALRPVVVTVSAGEVTALALEEGGGDIADSVAENVRAITGWFDYIEEWRRRSPARLEVSHDRDTGMPTRIFIDRHEKMADDEITWHLRDLKPLNQAGEADDRQLSEEAVPAPRSP